MISFRSFRLLRRNCNFRVLQFNRVSRQVATTTVAQKSENCKSPSQRIATKMAASAFLRYHCIVSSPDRDRSSHYYDLCGSPPPLMEHCCSAKLAYFTHTSAQFVYITLQLSQSNDEVVKNCDKLQSTFKKVHFYFYLFCHAQPLTRH